MELPTPPTPDPTSSSTDANEPFPRLHCPEKVPVAEDLLSPSLTRFQGDRTPAFELKMLVPEELARQVEAWAVSHLRRDEHALQSPDGTYDTTTLYLDTPALDMFHRQPGHRRRKYRLRRYGLSDVVFLERKARRGDKVRKRRTLVAAESLGDRLAAAPVPAWEGDWFRARVAARGLHPVCRISYRRTAFVAHSNDGPLRVTLDRQLCGIAAADWNLLPVGANQTQVVPNLLGEHVVCEFKFRNTLPQLFKEVIADLGLQVGSVSKYRRMLVALGLVSVEGPAHG